MDSDRTILWDGEPCVTRGGQSHFRADTDRVCAAVPGRSTKIGTVPELRRQDPPQGPQPIGEILEALLARYQVRFPGVHITMVETPVAAL